MTKVKFFKECSITDLQKSINDFALEKDITNVSLYIKTNNDYYATVLYREDAVNYYYIY